MCTILVACQALGWNRFITNKGYKKLYLCNENACHSISFNRNSDKLWYVSSHLKILRKAPVMRGKLYIYTMTKYQRFELLIFANWKNQRLRRGNEVCSSLTERGATFNYGRYMKGYLFFVMLYKRVRTTGLWCGASLFSTLLSTHQAWPWIKGFLCQNKNNDVRFLL